MKTKVSFRLATVLLCVLSFAIVKPAYSQFFGQKRIRGIDVKEQGIVFKTDISGIPKKTVDIDGFEVSITMMDPPKLNNMFYEQSRFDGQLDYTLYDSSREDFFLRKQKARTEKSASEFLIEGLILLLQSEEISESLYRKAYNDVIETFDETAETSQTAPLGMQRFNPYYLGSKYLSVFEIQLRNTESVASKFNPTILLTSGDNAYTPLSNIQILAFDNNQERINLRTLERVNFDSEIIIPGKSTLKRYIATLPLDSEISNFDIHLIGETEAQVLNWELNREIRTINEAYSYYELDLDPANSSGYDVFTYYTILTPNTDAYLNKDDIYINKNNIDKEIEIFAYIMPVSDELYYAKFKFKPSDYLDFTKSKRIEVVFETTQIEGIDRREKKKK